MKTIEIKVFNFSELSEDAKQKAIDHFRNNCNDCDWIESEVDESLEKFCKIFDISMRCFDPQEKWRNDFRFNLDDSIMELSGARLAAKIWTNYKTDLFKGKYYQVKSKNSITHKRVKSKKLSNGNIFNSYTSAITLDNSCVLTGVCYDDSLLKPIYDFLNKPDTQDFRELLENCISSLCKDVSSEIEYHNSDEGITEHIEANDYCFTIDGKLN